MLSCIRDGIYYIVCFVFYVLYIPLLLLRYARFNWLLSFLSDLVCPFTHGKHKWKSNTQKQENITLKRKEQSHWHSTLTILRNQTVASIANKAEEKIKVPLEIYKETLCLTTNGELTL